MGGKGKPSDWLPSREMERLLGCPSLGSVGVAEGEGPPEARPPEDPSVHLCVYLSLSLSLYIYIYICMTNYNYIYIYMHIYIYIYIHIHINICLYGCIYIYIYIYIYGFRGRRPRRCCPPRRRAAPHRGKAAGRPRAPRGAGRAEARGGRLRPEACPSKNLEPWAETAESRAAESWEICLTSACLLRLHLFLCAVYSVKDHHNLP